VLIGQISLVLSAGYGYRFILKFHWYESAGYEARWFFYLKFHWFASWLSKASNSNFLGLYAGQEQQMLMTQISLGLMLVSSKECLLVKFHW
jgi:hypothetical protein